MASLTAGLTTTTALKEVEDLEVEVEEDCVATVATAKDTELKTVLPPTLNNSTSPLYTLFDLNLPIPTSDIPNYHISSLTNFCFSEDYDHYKRLYDVQTNFLNHYVPAYSIHSSTAIDFYDRILNAPPFVLNTLTYGYRPGRLSGNF